MTARTMILYHTRSGHTKAAVRMLESELKRLGHAVETLHVELTKGKINYLSSGRAGTRQKDLDLRTGGIDLSAYDNVVLGQPVWAWKGCPVLKTYLGKCDGVRGKTFHAFFQCTSNPGKSFEVLEEQLTGMGARLGPGRLVTMEANDEPTNARLVREFAATVK